MPTPSRLADPGFKSEIISVLNHGVFFALDTGRSIRRGRDDDQIARPFHLGRGKIFPESRDTA